jgi:hypothetical protein
MERDAISQCLAVSCNFLKFPGDRSYYEVIDKIVKEQAKVLLDTLERGDAACDAISQRGHEGGAIGKCDLRNLPYFDIRRDFDLTAQASSAASPKWPTHTRCRRPTRKKASSKFRKHAAQPYDDRIVPVRCRDMVSISTRSPHTNGIFILPESNAPCSPIARARLI